MNKHLLNLRSRRMIGSDQRGVALFIVLIFLLILTLLGLAAMNGTLLGSRIAQNSVTRSLAYQAAELALRDAELDLECSSCRVGYRPLATLGKSGWATNCGGTDAQLKGQCLPSTPDVWTEVTNWSDKAVTYGAYTLAPWPSVFGSSKPKYLIEQVSSNSNTLGERRAVSYLYRITAQSYDAQGNPAVMLQSVYVSSGW